jgi:hypothetical protein
MKRILLVAALVAACSAGKTPTAPSPTPTPTPTPPPPDAKGCDRTSVGLTPLNDLTGTYQGEPGGLYPGRSNVRPAGHEAAGRAIAQSIQPLDTEGRPDATGRYALVSVGMSNTTMEFSAFLQLARQDSSRNPQLAIVDGAQGGQTAKLWSNPGCQCWGVLDQRLSDAHVSARQVVAAWLKEADAGPTNGWPRYAQDLRDEQITMLQILKARFPNLQLVYLSSRIYAGYALSNLNPEPYAYESGLAVRWIIEEQLRGNPALAFDGAAGAPWLSWGPYLWADGLRPRSDGLTWACSELSASDGTHPSSSGQAKVANLLLTFFQTDSTARWWYLANP